MEYLFYLAGRLSCGRFNMDHRMYVSDAEPGLAPVVRPPVPAFMRTNSLLQATIGSSGTRTAALRIHEAGALRLRFPRVGGACEGIILNTSGGVAGGDRHTVEIALADNAHAALTTQSAEKFYRSEGELAQVATRLTLCGSANLAWLPQEAILFDGARLSRRLDVEMAADASLVIKESVVFGRTAMAEAMTHGLFRERWRIRRDGRLILAEDIRLDGDISATLARAATGRGARAIATIVQIGSGADVTATHLRDVLAGSSCDAGVSAWNGMLVLRLAGPDPHVVRATSSKILTHLLPGVSPRIWSC